VQILPYSEEAEVKDCFRGKVNDYLYSGDVTSYIVELVNGTRIEALLPNSTPGQAKFFEVGDSVLVSWKYEAGIFLNE
jgi:spermidine/putrescine transport system ATP-binding protein